MDNTLTQDKKTKKREKKRFGEDYEFSPVRQRVTDLELCLGLLARSAVVSALVWGILLYINDALKLGVKDGLLFLFAFAFGLSLGMIFSATKMSFVGIVTLGITVLVGVVMHPAVAAFAVSAVSSIMNTGAGVFYKAGFGNVSTLLTSLAPEPVANVTLNTGGLYMIAALLALIFTLSTFRKTVILPVLIVSLAIVVPGITYNLPDSNMGFSLVVVSLFGIITMKAFDRVYRAKSEDKKRRASLGGFTGGAVTALAFLCIMIPSVTIKDKWTDISSISKPMSVARDIVTSVISGDMPNLSEMGLISGMDEQNSRNVEPKKLTYSGKSMLSLEKNYYKSVPVYLRGWVADGKFDGKAWYSPSNDTTDAYKALLSEQSQKLGYGEIYDPARMTEAFFELLGEGYSSVGDNGWSDHASDGYYIYDMNVDMVLGSGTGNLLYMPGTVDQSVGLRAFRSTDTPYKGTVKPLYDGMVLTNWFNLNKSYTVKSYVTSFTASGSAEQFFKNLRCVQAYITFMNYCCTRRNGGYPSYMDCVRYKLSLWEAYGLDEICPDTTFFDDFLAKSQGEQMAMYEKYVVMTELYSAHAAAAYGGSSDTGNYRYSIRNIVGQLDIENSDNEYDKIVKCVQYLSTHFTYTLDPAIGTSTNFTPYERFLNETGQGSCVQFATTLTLMLRELGFSARYVEGFIAKDFSTNDEGISVCDVKDSNAHAWVEVYLPGYGWLTVEATSKYARNYYGSDVKVPTQGNGYIPSEGSTNPGTNPGNHGGEEAPPDAPVDVTDPLVETKKFPWGTVFKVFLILLVVGGGGYLLCRFLKKRADAAVYSRTRMIETAVYGADDDEFREVAHGINADILLLMNIGGYAPNIGELPSEYAKRLDENCMYVTGQSFSEVMALIQKQEFSLEKDPEELKRIAEYLDLLWKDVYKTLGRPRRIWYRYFKLWI